MNANLPDRVTSADIDNEYPAITAEDAQEYLRQLGEDDAEKLFIEALKECPKKFGSLANVAQDLAGEFVLDDQPHAYFNALAGRLMWYAMEYIEDVRRQEV